MLIHYFSQNIVVEFELFYVSRLNQITMVSISSIWGANNTEIYLLKKYTNCS